MSSANGQSLMIPGQHLAPGEMLLSENEGFVLVYQADGNLVLYQLSQTEKVPTWASNTWGTLPGLVHFDFNGDLVIYDAEGVEVWRSRTYRTPGQDQTLRLQDDGNLVAYDLRPEEERASARAYWSTDTSERFERYAVLIGVEDYANFPGQELLAGRNDVLAMWQVCRRQGYKPENIRVCTSPLLDKSEIVAAEVALALSLEENRRKSQAEVRQAVETNLAQAQLMLGDARFNSVLEAVTWLGKKISAPFLEEKGTMVPAILSYSGHGAQVDGQLALCPSDVEKAADGDGPVNALRFGDIETLLSGRDVIMNASRNPLTYLTIVLDCCFSGAASGANAGNPRDNHRVTSLSSPKTRRAIAPIKPSLGQRIFCASHPDERGYQALLGGRWRGAFTWAFTQALEQWKVERNAGNGYSTISHTELLFRSRMLLEALSFRQHPMLLENIGNTPVFWSDGERVDGERYPREDLALPVKRPYTSADPNAERTGIQLDPTDKSAVSVCVVYVLTLSLNDGSSKTAYVLSVNSDTTLSNGTTYKAGWEYWKISDGFVNAWKGGSVKSLAFARQASFGTWDAFTKSGLESSISPATVMAQANMQSLTWKRITTVPASTMWSDRIGLSITGTSSVTWYYGGTSTPTGSYLLAASTTFSSTPPRDTTTWWQLT